MDFDELIATWPEITRPAAQAARKLILSQHPAIIEQIAGGEKVRYAAYFIGEPIHVVAVLGGGKDHCKLYLHHTSKISTGKLKLEGKGKHARHIKLFSASQLAGADYAVALKAVTEIAYQSSQK
jgi:hypothetical protein